jgi:hypothetical protein
MLYDHPLLTTGFLLLVGALAPAGAASQIEVSGTVVDNESGSPIPAATIELLSRRSSRLSRLDAGPDGSFRFTLRGDEGYRFRAAALGYRGATTPVLWAYGHDRVEVEIRLDPEAVLLAPLEVTAWSGRRDSHVLDDFRARLHSGLGHFFTRDDVERLRPSFVTDLLATLPGVHLQSSGRGSRRVVYIGRAAGFGACPAQIFVDGFLLNRRSDGDAGATLDDVVDPASIEGIEVYSGLAGVPAQFLNPDSRCGVVAVWTRRGDRGG